MGVVPAARDTVAVLSNIYTQTLGDWSLWLFYFGVVVTLYGTIFAATAAHSRMMADLARVARRLRTRRCRQALAPLAQRAFVVVLATVPAMFYWFFESPVRMVVAGGIAQALMLPSLGFAAIYLRHTQLPRELAAVSADDRGAVDLDGGDAGVRVVLPVVGPAQGVKRVTPDAWRS